MSQKARSAVRLGSRSISHHKVACYCLEYQHRYHGTSQTALHRETSRNRIVLNKPGTLNCRGKPTLIDGSMRQSSSLTIPHHLGRRTVFRSKTGPAARKIANVNRVTWLEPKVLDQGYEPLDHRDLRTLNQCLKRRKAPFASDRGQFHTARWRATVLSTNTSTTAPVRTLFLTKLDETEPFLTNRVPKSFAMDLL
jgi:hypothetical protein